MQNHLDEHARAEAVALTAAEQLIAEEAQAAAQAAAKKQQAKVRKRPAPSTPSQKGTGVCPSDTPSSNEPTPSTATTAPALAHLTGPAASSIASHAVQPGTAVNQCRDPQHHQAQTPSTNPPAAARQQPTETMPSLQHEPTDNSHAPTAALGPDSVSNACAREPAGPAEDTALQQMLCCSLTKVNAQHCR